MFNLSQLHSLMLRHGDDKLIITDGNHVFVLLRLETYDELHDSFSQNVESEIPVPFDLQKENVQTSPETSKDILKNKKESHDNLLDRVSFNVHEPDNNMADTSNQIFEEDHGNTAAKESSLWSSEFNPPLPTGDDIHYERVNSV